MLITVEDYQKLTGKTLADEELAKVETLLKIVISYIENMLGYTLNEETVKEIREYRKRIYLSYRPVIAVESVNVEKEWREGHDYIEFPKFKDCPCKTDTEEVEIIYLKGYRELPDWLKFELIGLVDDFIDSLEEIGKYTSYKIDDIAYSTRDLIATKKDKLNNIVRMIYG
jgi:hypothetical protein|nr:MAG TPA: hypothetical protein [Caudoviricetes sp.]